MDCGTRPWPASGQEIRTFGGHAKTASTLLGQRGLGASLPDAPGTPQPAPPPNFAPRAASPWAHMAKRHCPVGGIRSFAIMRMPVVRGQVALRRTLSMVRLKA